MGTAFLVLMVGVLIWQGLRAIGHRQLARQAAQDAELRQRVAGLVFDATHKKCPRCAEMVKAEALACRYCGNEFPAPRPALVANNAPPADYLSRCSGCGRDWIRGTRSCPECGGYVRTSSPTAA